MGTVFRRRSVRFPPLRSEQRTDIVWAVHAIIILVPISAFDQQLAEVCTAPNSVDISSPCPQDRYMNRLEDSVGLWKSVIENKVLAHVNIVLFLNKCDLLKKKLESGVRLNHYMPSYNRPNDYETVSQCTSSIPSSPHPPFPPSRIYIHLFLIVGYARRLPQPLWRDAPAAEPEQGARTVQYVSPSFFLPFSSAPRGCGAETEPDSLLDICHRYPEDAHDYIQRCVSLLSPGQQLLTC